MKHSDKSCGQNEEFQNIKAGGTGSNRCVLDDQKRKTEIHFYTTT
jgi:hypothetical protein